MPDTPSPDDWRRPLAEVWHRTFGAVKCHMFRWCPVCRDTDWPLAPWVAATEAWIGL